MRSWTGENIDLLGRLSEKATFRLRLTRAVSAARLLRKFDPNQPRVLAGNPDGGQWTGGSVVNDDVTGSAGLQPASYLLAAAGASIQYCMNQNTIDMLYCGTLQPAWYRAACRAQANERLAACLTGKPLPPLPF